MAELPKIVKSRLAQQRSADFAAHPDANLLAAFAEQTLLERERMAVSAHLAQCADCRESLALAGMAQPVAEPAAAAPKRHWFLEWRWVGAAAAACCVIAVVLQYRVQPPTIEKANYTVAPPAGAAPVPLPAQPAQQIAAAQRLKVEHFKKALQIPPPPSLAQEQSPPSVMTQLDSSAPERNPAAVALRTVEPPAPSGQADILPPSGVEPKAFRAETAETARAQKDIAAFQAKSGPSANVFVQGMVARAPLAAARTSSRLSKATVLWSINASRATAGNAHGVVERSLDAGKTWEVVPLSDDVNFRVVVSEGPHVWAGGTSGALFHSADGGAHWERITVSDEGDKLNGTIVNIDAQSLIKITTSSGAKWISSDGGRQWKRE
jgi:hypothetical protein